VVGTPYPWDILVISHHTTVMPKDDASRRNYRETIGKNAIIRAARKREREA